MVKVLKAEDNSWLLYVQMVIFCVGFVGLYVFMYWRSGGRESYYETKERKEARWNEVFGVGGPEVNLPDGMVLSALAQKVDKALNALLHDEEIDLSYCELDDTDAPALAALLGSNSALSVLDLSHNVLGATTLEALASIEVAPPCLRRLDLSSNGLLGADAGDALRRLTALCPALRELALSFNKLSDDGGVKLAEACRGPGCALTKISAARNGLGDATAYALSAALQSNTSLTSLAMWGNKAMSPAAGETLRKAWGEKRGRLALNDELD